MSDTEKVYSGLTFNDSVHDITKSDRKAVNKRVIIVVVLLIILSMGIGVALGYAIFYRETSDDGRAAPLPQPTAKPTIGKPRTTPSSQPQPSYNSWLDVPCNEYGEPQCPAGYEKRPLVLLSLDGFRADYLIRNFTPNIAKIANCGVHAPYMRPVFPTYTFPNHYSIATGLFPESHGIIANNMYDPVFRTVFSYGNSEAKKSRWWGGEPIWVTAEKQGLRSASYFWTGSDVEIAGVRPTYYFSYDGDTTYEQRVDTVLSWITMPEDKRPSLITLYFDEPDTEGHISGPFSDDINAVLNRVDNTVGDLMDGLVKSGLHHCVDLIVLADHGMTEISCDRVFFMHDYIDTYDYFYRLGAVTRLDPRSNAKIKEPVEVVDEMQCKRDHVTPYVKWEMPKNWHYANNRRIEDIVVVADDGWTISLRNDSSYQERYCTGGTHGYDNKDMTMGALFMAHGPSFKQNLTVDTFLATELYSLMTDILGVEAAPNNGTRGSLNHILRNPIPIEEPDKTDSSAPNDCPFPADYHRRIEMDMSNCTCESIKFKVDERIVVFQFDRTIRRRRSKNSTSS
ncbi:venom phosphodiesterase CdcPDE-like isoform X3 [Ptychodera flava]|uniref:venom phosphodiesterase CdcPDE-like isoform X3 n=1 Tax=Ptychodera flava TaxID=63121 RepID=UPI00396A4F4A